MSPVGLGSRNHCADEDQQQFSTESVSCESTAETATREEFSRFRNRQTVKYGRESRGTRNKKSLYWQGPAAI
jgi:hypothetical protein